MWKSRIRNWYGRNMTCVNMDEDSSLTDFFNLEDGNDVGGGGDDNGQDTSNDDSQNQDSNQDQTSQDADQEGDTGDVDDNDSDDFDNNGDNDDGDADTTRVDPRDAQIEQLLGMVEKLTKAKEPEQKDEPEAETDPFKTDAFDNLATAMNWDDDEKSAMKDFLALRTEHNNKTILTQAQQSIPQIVNSTMSAKEKQEAIKTSFYTEHPALAEVKDYAGLVAKTVAAEHQAQGKEVIVANVLNEAAERVYKTLKIQKVTKDDNKSGNKSGRGKKPAFASNNGTRQKSSKQTTDQAMISAIMDLDI